MSKKKILIIFVIVLVIGALFLLKTKGTQKDSANTATSGSAAFVNNDFVSALLGVQNISLDTDVLSSAVFKSLTPSGATVDSNPPHGRVNPFAPTTRAVPVEEEPVVTENPRVINFVSENNNNLLAAVKITTSKITSSTAVVTVSGLPENSIVSLNLSKSGGSPVLISDLIYKQSLQEYSTVLTGLSGKSSYTLNIASPELFNSITGTFQTK